MYYYCKNNEKKIVHLANCHHIRKTEISKLASFDNITEAEEKGYHVCKHCAGLKSYLRNEKEEIHAVQKKHGIVVITTLSYMYINTVNEQWIIIFDDERNCLKLFHRNSFETGAPTQIPHYHCQNFDSDTLCGYLNYIVEHDEYRKGTPLRIKQNKPKKARKGSKRYKNQQKKIAKKQHKYAVKNVLNLIDSLHLECPIAV